MLLDITTFLQHPLFYLKAEGIKCRNYKKAESQSLHSPELLLTLEYKYFADFSSH